MFTSMPNEVSPKRLNVQGGRPSEKCAYADEGWGGWSYDEKTQFLLYVTQIL